MATQRSEIIIYVMKNRDTTELWKQFAQVKDFAKVPRVSEIKL